LGAGELILNFVPNDGMMTGYNLELIKTISSAVSIPVVASCGAGTLEHMKDAVLAGAHALLQAVCLSIMVHEEVY